MDEITKRIVEMFEDLKSKQIKKPYKIIAEAINSEYKRHYSDAYICTKYNREIKKAKMPEEVKQEPKSEYKTTTKILPDGKRESDRLILMNDTESKSPEYLLKAHGFDVNLWEIVSAVNNTWNAYSKQDGIQVLYSSKITVKPRVDSIGIDEIKRHFDTFVPKWEPLTLAIPKGEYMLEIPIVDLHLGKLGWGAETSESYDHKIAESRLMSCIDDVINKSNPYWVEKVLFPIGNDFFNFDNPTGDTAGGTRQDNDLRWQKVFLKGVELLVQCIIKLSTVAPVEVFYIAGNHDKATSFYATNYLHAWFRNDKSVKVSIDPHVRKYVEYGNSLVGFSHGDKEKARIDKIMQVEAREAWGRTLYHEWHLAHLHSERHKDADLNGVNVRHISSICGTDAWHYESGFVGAVKKAQAFLWHKENGLEAILNSVIK